MVHTEEINEPTTLCLPTEEDWSQSIVELYYIRYIESLEETPFENKKEQKQEVWKTLSKEIPGSSQWIDILLRQPTHIQGQETKANSGPPQVHMSFDVHISCIPAIRTHP